MNYAIGQLPIKELAEQYGTPFFVYDEQRIRENFRRANEAFKSRYEKFRMFYAIKANCNLVIAKILVDEGAGIDAASYNEILLAQKLGLSGEDIMFSGNYLSDQDMDQGLASGVKFNLDDRSLLPKLLKYGTPEILSFRINPGIGKSNVGEFVVTAGERAKFGIKTSDALEAYRAAQEAGIKRFGIHMMTGSCVTDAEFFGETTRILMDTVGEISQKLGITFEFVDIGGGLGIPYRPDEKELDIEAAAEHVVNAVNNAVEKYDIEEPTIMMEPARYFVADAGYLVGRVHAIKESYKTFYGTDIGMNLVPRIILYDAYHHIGIDGKDGPTQPINLTGQICEQTDFWGKGIKLPVPEIGDLIVIENCGAYCYGMSYQYNGRLRPAEVLVNNGESYLIRHAETINDLTHNVEIPDHLTS